MSDLRRPLLLLAVAGFVSGMTIRVAEPMLPKVASDLAVSVGSASVLITGFTLAYGLFQIVHGPLGDRIGKLRAKRERGVDERERLAEPRPAAFPGRRRCWLGGRRGVAPSPGPTIPRCAAGSLPLAADVWRGGSLD